MRKISCIGGIAALVLLLGILAVPEAEAYESYHDPNLNDQGYCSTCHPGFAAGFSGPLHQLHVGGDDPVTSNCNLCHTGSGRDNPLTMWSTGDAEDGLGCAGCHGRDYGESVQADYRGFPIQGLAKNSAYGLRRHHQEAGITQCVGCHGDVQPYPEDVIDPGLGNTAHYYTRADVSLGGVAVDPCNNEDTANDTDGLGLDNDGDDLYDGDDPDCQAGGICGDGTVDPGEDCDGGECCTAECTFQPAGFACGDPSDTECDNPDSCDGAGACQDNFEPAGTACGDQGIECLVDDACDGAGACTDNGFEPDGTACGDPSSDQCNNPDACLAGACDPNWVSAGTPCDDGLFCNVDESCDGAGACAGGSPNACDDGVGCTDDSCDEVNDVCVNEPNDANCPDDGLFCNGTEFCDPTADCSSTGDPCVPPEICNEDGDVCEQPAECGNGTVEPGEECDDGNTLPGDCCAADCTFEPAGSACGDPSDTECTNPDSCDGAGVCDPNDEPAGTGCGDQGVECLVDDACNGEGACTDNGFEPDGTACGDPSSDQCDNADACLAGSCDPNWVPAGTPCDDGLFCNVEEACDGGGGCGGGGPRDCADAVACTVDSCNEDADSCEHTPDDAFCDDGLFCTGEDFCDVDLDCQSPGDPCPGGTVCNEDTNTCDPLGCTSDGECDDGLFCNGAETCDIGSGECLPGTPVDCDDGVDCTVDSCNEDTDLCENAPDDAFCDDGLFCTGAESCDPASGCVAVSACPPAIDGCVRRGVACDEDNDLCIDEADDTLCDNGLFCDGAETCDLASTECLPGTPVNCDDGVGCTQDSCNESAQACENLPDDALCDDDLFCNGAETCDPSLDCQPGTAIECPPGEVCDEDLDQCVPAAECTVDADCDDGLFCNGAETCVEGTCMAGTPVDCDDGVDCTVDACDEDLDVCVNDPDDAFCDDGLFCTGAESCDPVDGCVAISACPPMIEGCVTRNGECDEVNDTCIDVPDDALCDNGVFCDGAETCDLASTECLPGTPVDCDDGIGCTQDSCNESAQACDNLPDDALCDDGQFCNGAETCDPSLDCQPGTAIECPPGEVCDEDLDQCVPAAECTVDADCDDSMFCNGAETCVAGTCQPGTPVDCDDGVDCTVDACDEVNDSCVNTPDDAFCDDGLFCTGAESCDPEAGCVAISACPPFVDGCVIRGGECDEENDTCIDVPDDALCDNGMFCDGAETCDLASTECLPGTPPCDPDTEFCNEEADICEPTGEIVDIDIYKFQVSRQVVLQRGQDGSSSERRLGHTVKIKLWVDKPMLIDGPRPATVTGVDEAGNVIYTYTMMVDDMLVDEPTLFRFPEYRPMMPGMILWTASIADDDPDIDGATATTMVVE